MTADIAESATSPSLSSAVALLSDVPERELFRGQVGAIVETLDDETVLVEFSDNQGRAYAMAPCSSAAPLVLRTVPQGA